MEKIGCFSWLLLIAFCAWPFHALGLGTDGSMIAGLIAATLIIGAVAAYHRRTRVEDMREAFRRSDERWPPNP
jgi:hypothetical protein